MIPSEPGAPWNTCNRSRTHTAKVRSPTKCAGRASRRRANALAPDRHRPGRRAPAPYAERRPSGEAPRQSISGDHPPGLACAALKPPGTTPPGPAVRVWLPAMPPMLATTGISTASATSSRIVPSKRPITHAATNAVARFAASHSARRRDAANTGANRSSSSSRPAMLINERSPSSRMTSTTSSTVIRPSNTPSPSTTGAVSRLRCSNSRATSASSISTAVARSTGSERPPHGSHVPGPAAADAATAAASEPVGGREPPAPSGLDFGKGTVRDANEAALSLRLDSARR